MKTVLHLGAGQLMIATINILKASSYKVIAIDANEHAPAFQFADEFACIDIKDDKRIEQFAKEKKVDCILAVNDAGVNAAAVVSARLGLNYISPQIALQATDKGLMRQAWIKYNLPQPEFMIAKNENEINTAIDTLGYPVVIKPCLNWGSKGVSIINNESEKKFSLEFAINNNRNDRFIIEKKINGTELTIEGLVLDNQARILAVSDKIHQPHPQFCVAMQLNYPAFISAKLQEELKNIIERSVAALQLNNCAFHCECIFNDEGIFLVEMAARPGGGHIFSYIVEAASGISMPVVLTQILCGEKPIIEPKKNNGVTYRFFAPPAGVFNKLEHLESASQLNGVLELGFEMKPGTIVSSIAGDADRPGYMVTTAENREKSIEVSDHVLRTLHFVMS